MPTRPSLPAWPFPDPMVELTRYQQRQWEVDALPLLGFSLLAEGRFPSLAAILRAHADHRQRIQRYGKGEWFRPAPLSWEQWWRHPCGLLVMVDRYQLSSPDQWGFNGMKLCALGLPGVVCGVESQVFDDSGRRLAGVEFRAKDSLAGVWENLRQAQAEGKLLGFDQWKAANWLPMDGFMAWHEHRLPLGPRALGSDALSTPLEQSGFIARLRARHVLPLARHALAQIQSLPLPAIERELWTTAQAQRVAAHAAASPCPPAGARTPRLPAWVRTRAQASRRSQVRFTLDLNAAARALEKVIGSAGGTRVSRLSDQDRNTTRQWLSLVSARHHPRLYAQPLARASQAAPPEVGAGFHELVFATFTMKQGPARARWWQAHQSPATLARLCQVPGPDGLTLPMRWAEAWMEVPNEPVFPRRLALRQAAARRGLEELAQVVPMDRWRWASPKRSVWDPLFPSGWNTSVDDDLMAAHGQAVASFVAWAHVHLATPPATAFIPGQDTAVGVEDAPAVARALAQAGSSEAMMAPVDTAALLDRLAPVAALVASRRLGARLPAHSRPAPRSRARV